MQVTSIILEKERKKEKEKKREKKKRKKRGENPYQILKMKKVPPPVVGVESSPSNADDKLSKSEFTGSDQPGLISANTP